MLKAELTTNEHEYTRMRSLTCNPSFQFRPISLRFRFECGVSNSVAGQGCASRDCCPMRKSFVVSILNFVIAFGLFAQTEPQKSPATNENAKPIDESNFDTSVK